MAASPLKPLFISQSTDRDKPCDFNQFFTNDKWNLYNDIGLPAGDAYDFQGWSHVVLDTSEAEHVSTNKLTRVLH